MTATDIFANWPLSAVCLFCNLQAVRLIGTLNKVFRSSEHSRVVSLHTPADKPKTVQLPLVLFLWIVDSGQREAGKHVRNPTRPYDHENAFIF